MKKKSILPHSKMLFLQLVNSRIIGSLKEPKNTLAKEPVPFGIVALHPMLVRLR
jgi:hypothetical protein